MTPASPSSPPSFSANLDTPVADETDEEHRAESPNGVDQLQTSLATHEGEWERRDTNGKDASDDESDYGDHNNTNSESLAYLSGTPPAAVDEEEAARPPIATLYVNNGPSPVDNDDGDEYGISPAPSSPASFTSTSNDLLPSQFVDLPLPPTASLIPSSPPSHYDTSYSESDPPQSPSPPETPSQPTHSFFSHAKANNKTDDPSGPAFSSPPLQLITDAPPMPTSSNTEDDFASIHLVTPISPSSTPQITPTFHSSPPPSPSPSTSSLSSSQPRSLPRSPNSNGFSPSPLKSITSHFAAGSNPSLSSSGGLGLFGAGTFRSGFSGLGMGMEAGGGGGVGRESITGAVWRSEGDKAGKMEWVDLGDGNGFGSPGRARGGGGGAAKIGNKGKEVVRGQQQEEEEEEEVGVEGVRREIEYGAGRREERDHFHSPDGEVEPSSSPSTVSNSPDFTRRLSRRQSSNTTTATTASRHLSKLREEEEELRRFSVQSVGAGAGGGGAEEGEGTDWDFWGLVMRDYDGIAATQPHKLSTAIQRGIPPALRGMTWQLMAASKDVALESEYKQLLKQTSSHEKSIGRDLGRTFPKHEYFKEGAGGQECLFNVVKAYSLYDPEVGYTQGLQFIVGPLLLNMPEEEAFSVLVRLMHSYDLRSHYTPNMPGLQLRLFQFDRLLEEMLPAVFMHLLRQGVKSSMYGSQWFLTLYGYRFPLELVSSVFDLVFAEGVEAVFRFAISILKKNEAKILDLEFEYLVDFLKNGLVEVYAPDLEDEEALYKADEFVKDALRISIQPTMLDQFAEEWETLCRAQTAHTAEIETLRRANLQLSSQVRGLEASLAQINEEHCDLVKQVVTSRLEKEELEDELVKYKTAFANLSHQQAAEGARSSSIPPVVEVVRSGSIFGSFSLGGNRH